MQNYENASTERLWKRQAPKKKHSHQGKQRRFQRTIREINEERETNEQTNEHTKQRKASEQRKL